MKFGMTEEQFIRRLGINTPIEKNFRDGSAVGSAPKIVPTITNALSASGTVNLPFSFTLTAVGDSPITFTATGLPQGLSLSGAIISGVPATAFGSPFSVIEKATNDSGSNTKTLLIYITASSGGGGGEAP